MKCPKCKARFRRRAGLARDLEELVADYLAQLVGKDYAEKHWLMRKRLVKSARAAIRELSKESRP